MTNTNIPNFDIEAAMQALREGKDLMGKNGIQAISCHKNYISV